jgi:hypothetical protein
MALVVASGKGSVTGAVSDTVVVEHGAQLPPSLQLLKICILSRAGATTNQHSPASRKINLPRDDNLLLSPKTVGVEH